MAQALFGVQNAMRSVIIEIGNFDQAIFDTASVLNKTKKEATELALSVRNLAKIYGTSSEEIHEGLLTIGRAGVDSTQDAKDAIKVLTELAMITGDSIADGAQGMAKVMSVYSRVSR